MRRQTRDQAFRELLRAGDPLPPGEELENADANRMRRAVLAAASQLERRRPWRMALAAAALAALTAGAYLLSPRGGLRDDPGVASGGSDHVAVADLTDEPRDRQIQFTTRGGTRVIWVLRPSSH